MLMSLPTLTLFVCLQIRKHALCVCVCHVTVLTRHVIHVAAVGGKQQERAEQHLYGNVLTTGAALHLHGFSVLLLDLFECTSLKQIKEFHQNLIGRRGEEEVEARK